MLVAAFPSPSLFSSFSSPLCLSLSFLRFHAHLYGAVLSITHFLCFMKSRGINPMRQAAKNVEYTLSV